MKSKKENIFWILGSIFITALFLLPFVLPDFRSFVERVIRAYPYAAPAVIFVFRFLTVVLAPLSGAPVAFASMALLPWRQAFVYNFFGNFVGALSAFFIARHFRERVVAHFAPLQKIHDWQARVSGTRQFWSFVGLRFIALSAFDFISYAAGLTNMPFRTFFWATLMVDLPVTFVFFYVGGIAVQYSVYAFVVFVVLFLVAAALVGKNFLPGGKKRI